MDRVALPAGFRAHVANIGIKDDTDDFVVIASDRECVASAMFTRSRFAGPSVVVSRRNVADGHLRALAVISKNANVATGDQGLADAEELVAGVASAIDCAPGDVLVASTGVIGVLYPMDRVREHLSGLRGPFDGSDAVEAATAMMTTDTHPKVAVATVGDGADAPRVVGIAKGVGMIEPDMATMLAFVLTDAAVPRDDLERITDDAVQATFNSLSVDTDTSTSDTVCVMANGAAGTVEPGALAAAVTSVCTDLTRQLARDGEGATKLLIVDVSGARDDDQARRVAKSVVNSPLVKTAVHGADPNWGRVAMAIGKCSDDSDIDPERLSIGFGGTSVYPGAVDGETLRALEDHLRHDEVTITVDLGIAQGAWRVYGCDLSDGYVRINADYTT